MGPALHRAAVPGLVLPGELGNLPCGRDDRVRSGCALAAAEPRLVRWLPVGLLVHRAAVSGRALVAGARGDRAERARRSPTKPGKRATTSSGSSSCSPPSRSRSMRGAAGRGAVRASSHAERTGDALSAGRARGRAAAGTKLNFLLPAAVLVVGLAAVAPRGQALARARRDRPRRARRRRLLVPAQPGPHRQPAALVRPPRADLAAGARTGAGRPRRPQRARLPDRRLRLVGLVPARPAPRPDDPLAPARRPRPGRPRSSASGRRRSGRDSLPGRSRALAGLAARIAPG